jgi:hypothetical protein
MVKTNEPDVKQKLLELKAQGTNDIKYLLTPYLSFRAYVVFKAVHKSRRHFYGNEHECTYNQLLHQHLPFIVLRKSKGYWDLVNYIEKTLKGKYQSAAIYMRSIPGGKFDVLCRRYFKGALQDHDDPLLSEDEGFKLFYLIQNGRVVISETDPNSIDFKKEINSQIS